MSTYLIPIGIGIIGIGLIGYAIYYATRDIDKDNDDYKNQR